MQKAAGEYMSEGLSATAAARKAGYKLPKDAGKALRHSQPFMDFVVEKLRDKAIRYHQLLELSKQNIIYLLSSDGTPDNVRAQLALGLLKVLARAGKDGKTLIEKAMDEDKAESDPKLLVARLLAETNPPPAPEIPGAAKTIDAEIVP